MVRATIDYTLEDFLGSTLGITITSSRRTQCTIAVQLTVRIFLYSSSPTGFNHLFRQVADLTPLRLLIVSIIGTGILTGFPSTSPLGYALGPD